MTSDNPLHIGGNPVWGEYFAGLIDNVRVYNRRADGGADPDGYECPGGERGGGGDGARGGAGGSGAGGDGTASKAEGSRAVVAGRREVFQYLVLIERTRRASKRRVEFGVWREVQGQPQQWGGSAERGSGGQARPLKAVGGRSVLPNQTKRQATPAMGMRASPDG